MDSVAFSWRRSRRLGFLVQFILLAVPLSWLARYDMRGIVTWWSYAINYALLDPAGTIDQNGKYAGVDDAIFAIGGAAVGLIGQGLSDVGVAAGIAVGEAMPNGDTSLRIGAFSYIDRFRPTVRVEVRWADTAAHLLVINARVFEQRDVDRLLDLIERLSGAAYAKVTSRRPAARRSREARCRPT
jgi:hypothetical protein